MADARVTIEGRIAADPRYNSVNGKDVANLRVLAGRSRKNESDQWETLSQTAYNVAFWNDHAHLVDALKPNRGDSVVVTGTILGLEKYDGENGSSLSAKVSGDGLRVFPKRQDGFGGQQQASGQQSGQQQSEQSGPTWGQEHQAQAGGDDEH